MASNSFLNNEDYNFVDEVPDKLKCSICTKALREPRLTECCGQHFCQQCLQSWFKEHGNKTCPHCRGKDFINILDKPVKREINQLKVRCSYHSEGCEWVGKLGDLQTHFNSEQGCGYVEVKCPNGCLMYKEDTSIIGIICTTVVKRKLLKEHLEEDCDLREYECAYCGYKDTYGEITGYTEPFLYGRAENYEDCHYDSCLEYPLDCPNECGVTEIKRKDIFTHREQCPMELIECPNKCTCIMELYDDSDTEEYCEGYTRIKRRDLEDHLNKCDQRMYKCEHCRNTDKYANIINHHYPVCPNFPLNCPNKCGAKEIKRCDMPTHQKQCPLEPVQCPFLQVGCDVRLIRKNLEEHVASQIQTHLLLTVTRTCSLEQKCTQLTKTNAELGQKCQTLQSRNDDLHKRCKKLEEKLESMCTAQARLGHPWGSQYW